MNNAIAQNQIQTQRLTSATRIAVSTFGGIVSIAGVMHGCFELLQGNVAPGGVVMFFLAVGTTIFGLPLTLLFDQNTTYLIVLRSGNFMLIVMLLSVLSAFAHDLQAAERRLD